MNDQDIAIKRRNRLKTLRANLAAQESGIEQEVKSTPTRRRPGWRPSGLGGEARRLSDGVGGDFRARILRSLRDVGAGDQLIKGTDVGRDNLKKLLDRLDSAESNARGKRLGEIVRSLLDPVESDRGLEFSAEGVAKLVSFLEEGPGPDRGRSGAAGRGLNRPRGRGWRGGY